MQVELDDSVERVWPWTRRHDLGNGAYPEQRDGEQAIAKSSVGLAAEGLRSICRMRWLERVAYVTAV